jgi:hypothetical protein
MSILASSPEWTLLLEICAVLSAATHERQVRRGVSTLAGLPKVCKWAGGVVMSPCLIAGDDLVRKLQKLIVILLGSPAGGFA